MFFCKYSWMGVLVLASPQILPALAHVHARGIAHGSLCADSVLMDSAGNPYLAHFQNSLLVDEPLGLQERGVVMECNLSCSSSSVSDKSNAYIKHTQFLLLKALCY